MPHCLCHRSSGRIQWALLVFLFGSAILIAIVSFSFLIPAMQLAVDATPQEKRWLRATSSLLLTVVLFVLLVGMMLVFRASRWYRRNTEPAKRVKTEYVDAWAEAGKRVKVDPDEEPRV